MNEFTSTPNISEFDPRHMPWQFELLQDIRTKFDYSQGTHECLLSGTVGSGKSLPAAHIIVTHVCMYPGSNFGIGRRALPDLKDTLCQKIQEHLASTGISYEYSKASGDFVLPNYSKITTFSWADGNYRKFGSYELSGFAMEEAQENQTDQAYQMALSRIGRLPHVPESIMIAMANPDSPTHWLAKRFGVGNGKPENTVLHHTQTRHAYFSKTESNKFLPESYIKGLKENMDPKLARRLLYGEWIEIDNERIYHAYSEEKNYKLGTYVTDLKYPINMSFDFNIAKGKPLSAIFSQYIKGEFHYFDETIVEGLNTEQNLEESAGKGLFELKGKFIVHGDASGRSSDTRSNRSDYDIIRRFLSNYRRKDGTTLTFEIEVPPSNPSVRDRHNKVNAQCLNSLGQSRLFVYEKCKVLNEGMRLTALKNGAGYIEDDSKPYQHCTTALGYDVCSTLKHDGHKGTSMMARNG